MKHIGSVSKRIAGAKSLTDYKNHAVGNRMRHAIDALEDAAKMTGDEQIRKACLAVQPALRYNLRRTERTTSLAGGYVMLAVEQTRLVNKAIRDLPPQLRPNQVRDVFYDAVLCVKHDSGRIETTRTEIADRLSLPPREVSRALGVLSRLHIFERQREGRGFSYYLNPHVGWRGSLRLQEKAAERTPPPTPPQQALKLELVK